MTVQRVLQGTYREVWQEAVQADFDGPIVITLPTGIHIGKLTERSRCKAVLRLTAKTGTPIVVDPTFGMTTDGYLTVIYSNTALAGNMAAYTLEVLWYHSVQQRLDITYAGLGVVVDSTGGGSTPPLPTGTIRIYVDATNGDDANSGTSWVDAFKSLARAETEAHDTLSSAAGLPPDVELVVYVDGDFTNLEILRLNDPLIGSTRVHVVHPFTRWTTVVTGTLTDIPVTPTDDGHGLQAIEPSFAVDLSMVGKVLRFEEQGGTAAACFTILKVDETGSNHMWITRLAGPFPAWVIDGGSTDLSVLEPHMTAMNGLAIFLGGGSMTDNQGVWMPTSPKSWVVGMMDTSVYATGPCFGCVGLYDVRSGFGTPPTIKSTGEYFEGRYSRIVAGVSNPGLSDALAEEFGIFTGAGFDVTAQDLGNCVGIAEIGGDYSWFAGVASSEIRMTGGTGSYVYAFTTPSLNTTGPCFLFAQSGILTPGGFGASAGVSAVNGGRIYGGQLAYESTDEVDFFYVDQGGYIQIASGMFTQAIATKYSTANPSVVFHAYDGTIFIGSFGERSNPPQMAGATNLIRVDAAGMAIVLGAILQGFPGGGADFYVKGGRIHFAGGVTKQKVNPTVGGTPQPILQMEDGGWATQPDGMGGVFQVDEGAGDYVVAYGANGAIYLTDNSEARLAGLTSGGAATSVGCTIQNGSKLCHSGVGLTGAGPLKLGGNAAAAWSAAPASDLAAGVPQFCFIIPDV
jgi:hypothetical protein